MQNLKATEVVQDIKLTTDNVLFRKQKYYSPQRENLLSGTTRWLRGEFGPGIKALVISLYYGSNMTQSKFLEFLGILVFPCQQVIYLTC